MAELEYLGKCGKTLLEKHLKENKSNEAQRRLKELLNRIPSDPADIANPNTPPPVQPAPGGRGGITITSRNGQREIIIDGQRIDLNNTHTGPAVVVVRPNPGWLRASRAVSLLEHLGTPEARQVLQVMAQVDREAQPTRDASEALDRLKKCVRMEPRIAQLTEKAEARVPNQDRACSGTLSSASL
jgi:hypothetical protein